MAEDLINKDWNKSLSINNDGDVPFSRLVDLTPREREQACKNIGVASNDAVNRLEQEVIQQRGIIASAVGDVASAINDVNSAVGSAQSALSAAQDALTAVNTVTANMDALSAKVDTNSGNITTLSSDVSTLSANVGTISGKNTSQDNKIGELSSSVAGLTNSAVYHEAVINNLTTAWTAFSAAEDAVITAATAAIPGQVSAEVSGQLSGKQDKLTPGVNISLIGNVIDVRNNNCQANGNASIALGFATRANGNYTLSNGYSTSATGMYAHAEGYETLAAGQNSHSEGYNTKANNNGTHAEGFSTTAAGTYSHAEGRLSIAQGNYSHVEGNQTFANGSYAHAEGQATSAINAGAHTEGIGTNASGTYSHAEGNATRTSGIGSHAEGYATSAIGGYSHAEGNIVVANALHSHAEGAATSAMNQYSHVEGRYTISDTGGQHVEGQYNAPALSALHVIGNGTSTANRSNIIETYSDRVVVNGDLINDTLSDFMFDNSQIATGTKTCVVKLDTNDWYCSTTAYTNYNKKYANIMSGENFNITRSSGYQYPATIVCGLRKTNNYPVGIVEWKGDISKICWNGPSGAGNKNYVSSWPAQLPDPTYISTFERMFSENVYVTGPDTVPTNLLELTSGTSVGVPRIFQDASKLSGNWDVYVSTWSAKPTSGKINCFRGCTGIDNYATYTANSSLSSMFLG